MGPMRGAALQWRQCLCHCMRFVAAGEPEPPAAGLPGWGVGAWRSANEGWLNTLYGERQTGWFPGRSSGASLCSSWADVYAAVTVLGTYVDIQKSARTLRLRLEPQPCLMPSVVMWRPPVKRPHGRARSKIQASKETHL